MENKLLGFGNSGPQNKEGNNMNLSSNTSELPGINEILTKFISQSNPSNDADPKAKASSNLASTGFSWGNVLDGYLKIKTQPGAEDQLQKTASEAENIQKSFTDFAEKRDTGIVRKNSIVSQVLPGNGKLTTQRDQPDLRVGSRSNVEDIYLNRNLQETVTNSGFQTDSKKESHYAYAEEQYPANAPRNQVFKFSKFEDFVKEMARPLKQQDVKSKLSELKDLVSSLKEIKKDDSNEKFEEVFNQLLRKPPQNADYQPLYKIVAGFGPEYFKKFNKDNARARQQKKPMINNPNLIVDQAKGNYHRHAEADEFESYLKKKNDQKEEKSADPSTAQTSISQKGSLPHPTEVNIQPELTSLQYFLTQNLKETLELKELLRQKALSKPQENNGGISDMLASIKKVQTRAETVGVPDQSNLINNSAFGTLSRVLGKSAIKEDLYSNERRLHEAQTDRLIAKINSLNKQIEDLQKDKFDSKRFVKSLPFSLKVGHVRVSRLLTDSLENFRLENYDSRYGFTDRFLVIYQNSLVFLQNEHETNDTLEISFADIEEIIRIECISEFGFAIKLVERSNEEPKIRHDASRNRSKKKRDNKRNIGGLTRFHIVTMEDGKDFLLWDGAFFVVNTRIIIANSRPYLNDVELLYSLQEFSLPLLQESHHMEANNSESLKVESINSTPKSVIEGERQPSLKNLVHRKSKNFFGAFVGSIVEEDGRFTEQKSEIKMSTLKPISNEAPNSIPNTGRVRTPDKSGDTSSSMLIANLDALKTEILTQSKRPSLQISRKKKTESQEITYQRAIKHLQNGEVFLKYGTWGKPHEKIVKLSENGERLEWLSIDSGKKSEDIIEFKDLLRIEDGRESSCFKKMKNCQEILANTPERVTLFFSIVSKKRSLDLESGDEKRKMLFLQALNLIWDVSKRGLTVEE